MISKIYYFVCSTIILIFVATKVFYLLTYYLSKEPMVSQNYSLKSWVSKKDSKKYHKVNDKKGRFALNKEKVWLGDQVEEYESRRVFELIASDSSIPQSWKFIKRIKEIRYYDVKNKKERLALDSYKVAVGDKVKELETRRSFELIAKDSSKPKSWKYLETENIKLKVFDKKERLALSKKKVVIGDEVEETVSREFFKLIASDPSKPRSWKYIKTDPYARYHTVWNERERLALEKEIVWLGDSVEERSSRKVYVLESDPPSNRNSWRHIKTIPTPTPVPTPAPYSNRPSSTPYKRSYNGYGGK